VEAEAEKHTVHRRSSITTIEADKKEAEDVKTEKAAKV